MAEVAVAILAGGESRRMGADKTRLLLHGKPLLQHVIERVTPLERPILLISNTPDVHEAFGLPIVPDAIPGVGALGGLYTALLHSPAPRTLVVAADMPFLNTALLAHLLSLRSPADAYVPFLGGHWQPLHAVYRQQSCLPVFREQIAVGQLKIQDSYARLRVQRMDEATFRAYDPHLRSVWNINTPQDLARAEELGAG